MPIRLLTTAAALSVTLAARIAAQDHVSITVQSNVTRGPMTPVWAWFGNDEPNYAYMPDGKKLLSALAKISPVPVHMRTHNLLTTGDGTPALKWGSTNAYTEDANGNPKYDWTIVDRIFDTYMQRGMKPLVEIGFMPEALSIHPTPYKHSWTPTGGALYTGWSYPPNDYDKWRELVYQWVKHSFERYGKKEVESWYWEVWNEPDIGYWHGTPEEYMKLYDFAADGLKRALPTARVGGPEVTGPNGARTQGILRNFLAHALHGTNYATGETGSPLDFVTFHAKGAPNVMPDGHVRMNVANQLRAIRNGFEIVASFPELKHTPVVIGESDPEGCAACDSRSTPSNAYRNGTMYSSYTVEQLARTYELADKYGVNLIGAVTWAFEFEGQPWFDGFRDLATNGVNKPVFNVFEMLGEMRGDRVAVTSNGGLSLDSVVAASVRGHSDVDAMASRGDRSVSVLVWNYHDDDLSAGAADVELAVDALPVGQVTVTQTEVDHDRGNSYEKWKSIGSPQTPAPAQIRELERAAMLEPIAPPARREVRDGRLLLRFPLQRQAVSLVRITW